MDIIEFDYGNLKFGVPTLHVSSVLLLDLKDLEREKGNVLTYEGKVLIPFIKVDLSSLQGNKFLSISLKDTNFYIVTSSRKANILRNVGYSELKPEVWFPPFYLGVFNEILIVELYEYVSFYEKHREKIL